MTEQTTEDRVNVLRNRIKRIEHLLADFSPESQERRDLWAEALGLRRRIAMLTEDQRR